jgi:hypothetical protein
MNILDIISTDEFFAFEEKFGSSISLVYLSAALVYATKDNCYYIPTDETYENVLQLIKDSLKTGKDLLFEKYKENVYENDIPEDAII